MKASTRSVFHGGNRKVRSGAGGASGANGANDGVEALEGFVIGLYQETFNTVVHLINR